MPAGKGSLPESIAQIKSEWEGCTKCDLAKTRRNIVFGESYGKRPLILIIGEAPGEDEDRLGIPFCGASGQLLWQFLDRNRLSPICMITNVVACHPPGNRDPYVGEVNACRPRIEALIANINPFLIITVGRIASSRMQHRGVKIMSERGKMSLLDFAYNGSPTYQIPTIPVLHPAYLLRNGRTDKDSDLRRTFEDFQMITRLAKTFAACHQTAGKTK